MKILYVVTRPIEINTSASIRNKATLSGLVKNGHKVDLLTTQPDKNHMAFDLSNKVDGVNKIYIESGRRQELARVSNRFKSFRFIKRYLAHLFSRGQIYDNFVGVVNRIDSVNINLNDYDIIISSSDPKSSHLLVYEMLHKCNGSYRGKWIQVWGDPFANDITLQGKNIERVKEEELKLVSKADKVVYVSETTLKHQIIAYPTQAEKMKYLPIPYAKSSFFEARDLTNTSKIKVAYCGDYSSRVRNIIPLYDAVKDMRNVYLTICGLSDLSLTETDNISILPRQTVADVERIEAEADILIHLSNLRGTQIPGKIYQYSGTNKPIVFILDGEKEEIKSTFEKYNRFIFCENDAEQIIATICSVKENSKNLFLEPITEFSPECVCEKLIFN